MLREFLLRQRRDAEIGIEHQGAGRGGALIDGKNVGHRRRTFR
jgi:hypothetical protein